MLTEAQKLASYTAPLFGRKGLRTQDPAVLFHLVGTKVHFGADANAAQDIKSMFPWVVANARDLSYFIAIEVCRNDPTLRIQEIIRKPISLYISKLRRLINHDENPLTVDELSLSPGSVITLSYDHGIERIEDEHGETVYEREEEAKPH